MLVSSAAMANITREEGRRIGGRRRGDGVVGAAAWRGGRYINGEFGRHDSPRKVSNESSIKQSFRVGHGTQKGKEAVGRGASPRSLGRLRGPSNGNAIRDHRSPSRGASPPPDSKLLLDPFSEGPSRRRRLDLQLASYTKREVKQKAIGSCLSFFLPSFIIVSEMRCNSGQSVGRTDWMLAASIT